VRLPAGFRRAAPGEAGAMRAADAVASGLKGLLAEAARDAPDAEAEDTKGPDTSLAGSARLARIAARIRGDAPRRPPAGKRVSGSGAAPGAARRGSPPSAPAPAAVKETRPAGSATAEAAKRRAAAGAAARVEAAAARRAARGSDGYAGGDSESALSESARDGDVLGDTERDADEAGVARGFKTGGSVGPGGSASADEGRVSSRRATPRLGGASASRGGIPLARRRDGR
jgi:hypothetical protein